MVAPSVDEIRDSFAFFDDWEDRYKFIIDLGRALPPMDDTLKVDANIVRGCQSQVWIDYRLDDGRLYFTLDSDAMIVRGLIAIVLAAFDGRHADSDPRVRHRQVVQRTRPDAASQPDAR